LQGQPDDAIALSALTEADADADGALTAAELRAAAARIGISPIVT
jgi:hypothetical protein